MVNRIIKIINFICEKISTNCNQFQEVLSIGFRASRAKKRTNVVMNMYRTASTEIPRRSFTLYSCLEIGRKETCRPATGQVEYKSARRAVRVNGMRNIHSRLRKREQVYTETRTSRSSIFPAVFFSRCQHRDPRACTYTEQCLVFAVISTSFLARNTESRFHGHRSNMTRLELLTTLRSI